MRKTEGEGKKKFAATQLGKGLPKKSNPLGAGHLGWEESISGGRGKNPLEIFAERGLKNKGRGGYKRE